jgi:hypothetical protein
MDGVIDTGPPISRGAGRGVLVFAIVVASAVGIGLGVMVNKLVSGTERKNAAIEKAETMLAEVEKINETRATVATTILEIEKTAQANFDPAAEAQKLNELVQGLDQHPDVDLLFGWQLAGLGKQGITAVFQLYEEAQRLQTDLRYLAGWVQANAEALGKAGGPGAFGIVLGDNTGTLVGLSEPVCGTAEEEPQPCQRGDTPVAFKVLEDLGGGEPKTVPIGPASGQMLPLSSAGLYAYAVGMEPTKNALALRNVMMARVKERLESMDKAGKRASTTISAYVGEPNLDGSSVPTADE